MALVGSHVPCAVCNHHGRNHSELSNAGCLVMVNGGTKKCPCTAFRPPAVKVQHPAPAPAPVKAPLLAVTDQPVAAIMSGVGALVSERDALRREVERLRATLVAAGLEVAS